jgi:hypothetical protein
MAACQSGPGKVPVAAKWNLHLRIIPGMIAGSRWIFHMNRILYRQLFQCQLLTGVKLAAVAALIYDLCHSVTAYLTN